VVNGRGVHNELSVALRKGQRVLDPIGVEGEIVGFKSTRTWSFRRPSRISWVIVRTADGLQSYRSAAELRVVERKAVA
jgi:hypothetical protein